MRDVYSELIGLLKAGKPLAWATIVSSSGSTPQKAGSHALYSTGGLLAGTIGGGIIEAQVGQMALDAIREKRSGINEFLLDDSPDGEGALCGGRAEILLDGDPGKHLEVLEEVAEAFHSRVAGGMLCRVDIENNAARVSRKWVPAKAGGPLEILDGMTAELLRAGYTQAGSPAAFYELEFSSSGKEGKVRIFYQHITPMPRLIIAGAGHVGKAVSHLGNLLDFEVTVIDDREEFANPRNLPDADHILCNDLALTLEGSRPGPGDYIVIVTRGHQHDTECLKKVLGSGAAYIGMIGSKAKVAGVKRSSLGEGWASESDWDRIHSPIGLEIGSKSVQEIAVSIAAELILERNRNRRTGD